MEKTATEEAQDLLRTMLDMLENLDRETTDDAQYLQIDNSTTRRTSIRITEEQAAFGDKLKNKRIGHSRELAYSYCVEFARHNREEFVRFAMNYIISEVENDDAEKSRSHDTDSSTSSEPEESQSSTEESGGRSISDESSETSESSTGPADQFEPDVPDPIEYDRGS